MKVGLIAAIVAIAVVAGLSAPDIKHYMKIRNM
jgi:Flp pilus assembly pilin Flp